MRLHRLHLKNYRNYQELQISFNGNIHFLIGDNAQGKTNLLESIYMLALTKSHRTNKDQELILWGQERAVIQCDLTIHGRNIEINIEISPLGKKVLVNRIEQKKISKYIGQLRVVLFAPEDLQLVKGSPNQRRKFIDRAIGQLRLKYISDLSQYQKILQQRNQLLKKIIKDKQLRSTLELWDMQLIEYGQEVINMRQEYLEQIAELAESIHYNITDGKEKLRLLYAANCLAGNFREKLEKNIERDLYTGMTSIGPHRDEMEFYINDIDAKIYGSQGQQRTVALSLKLAELEYIKIHLKDTPILLLDDVLSELDQKRQRQLLDSIGDNVQTFVTTTDIDGIKHEIVKKADFFYIKNGTLIKSDITKKG